MSDEMFEDEYIELAQGRAYWQARAIAAERRVAELEARLAEQEWRPVTEKPGKADWRSGFLVDTKNGIVYYADEYDKGAWLWGDGYMKEIEAVTHWIFLPTSQNKTQG